MGGALALYEVDRHGTQALTFGGHDARECALNNVGTALFLLGYPERAMARRDRGGLARAEATGGRICTAELHRLRARLRGSRRP